MVFFFVRHAKLLPNRSMDGHASLSRSRASSKSGHILMMCSLVCNVGGKPSCGRSVLQGHWKKDSGLSLYFQTEDLKYSPVGTWLVHIWVSWDMVDLLMDLNHFGGLSLRNVEVFLALAKGRNPLGVGFIRKIFWSWSSRSSRKACHSLSACVSTSVRAAERETKRGRR